MTHKKKIKRAIKHLRVLEEQLDKEKHSKPKLYESRERQLEPVYQKILKL